MYKQGYGKSSSFNGGRSKFGGSTASNRGYRGYNRNSARRKSPYFNSDLTNEMFISKAQKGDTDAMYDVSLTFKDFSLAQKLYVNISHKGYVHPTKIQAEIIPQALLNKDVLGIACTGSGKTAAYLIPMVNKLLKNDDQKCLIIAPTRELTSQIKNEYQALAYGTNLRDVMVMGGASYADQIRLIKRDPHFVIATPGRLLDLCDKRFLNLSTFNNVILDEVDEMLDMGFINDVRKIVAMMTHSKQSLFFSATMSAKTEEIANSLLKNPYKVEMEKQVAVKNVDQDIVRVSPSKSKIDVLHELLINADYKRVLVFSKTKRGAEDLSLELRKRGHKSDSLHGNKSLGQRSKALNNFRRLEIDILVATDVASRGIDVPDISHVINYDPPATAKDYIHRVGRTGRMGKKGIALTFVK